MKKFNELVEKIAQYKGPYEWGYATGYIQGYNDAIEENKRSKQ